VRPFSAAVLKRLVALLAPALALLALAVATVHARERSEDRGRARQAAFDVVRLQSHAIVRVIEMVSSILLYLSEESTLTRFLSGAAPQAELEADYVQFCRAARMFGGVRVLDLDGREILQVRAVADSGESLPPQRLAPLPAADFAAHAAALSPGRVYVSRFDLTRDAHGALGPPWKPVIRFAALAPDADGVPAGLLVLDYYGDSILRLVRQTGQQVPGWTALVDGGGHFLEAPEGQLAWTSVRGQPAGFARDHPAAWAALQAAPVGQHLDERGLYVHSHVPTPTHRAEALSELEVTAVCHVPSGALYARSRGTLRILLWGAAAVAAVLTAVAWRLAHAAVVRAGHEQRLADSERGLRKLSARLVEAQEDERRRISRDLHDELGQQATAIAIGLKRAARSDDERARGALLDQALAATDELLAGVHRISTSLRTTLLDDLGLSAALRATCSDLGERTGTPIHVELDFDERALPADVARTVYRFVQEGLTNAIKHARATEIRVTVRAGGARLAAEVRDDGRGFDARAPHEDRLGLLGMRERIELARGEFHCDSAPGTGTRLSASFALDAPPPEDAP